jgi:hypothetical protein
MVLVVLNSNPWLLLIDDLSWYWSSTTIGTNPSRGHDLKHLRTSYWSKLCGVNPWPLNFKGFRCHDFLGIPCIQFLFFHVIDDVDVQGFKYQFYEFLLHEFMQMHLISLIVHCWIPGNFFHVLFLVRAIKEIFQLFHKWSDPKLNSSMYKKDLPRDWPSSHF